MMKRFVIAMSVLVTAGVGAPATVEAQEVPFVAARPVYRRVVASPPDGAPRSVRTDDLRNSDIPADPNPFPPDTFLVVRDLDSDLTVFNDDCPIGTPTAASCVTIPPDAAGPFLITIFSLDQRSFGRTDVLFNGVRIDDNVEFGGTVVDLDFLVDQGYTFWTVHLPDGADDTQLMMFDSNWNEKVSDNDTGIEEASLFARIKRQGDRLVVGSFSTTTRGTASVIINFCVFTPDDPAIFAQACHNVGEDADGDNLSNALEDVLGTDVFHHDSDRDGLYDFYEVIGRRGDDGTEQELRRLGADPLVRDIFLEFDRRDTISGTMPTAEIEAVAETWEFLQLPDSGEGVRIHADIGASCPGLPTLCGDFGGHDIVDLDEAADEDETTAIQPGFIQANETMAKVRRGIFHYAFVTGSGEPCGAGGKALTAGATFWVCSQGGLGGGIGPVTSHELGHNLGLSHWGGPSNDPDDPLGDFGTNALNFKTIYRSVMNYAYQERTFQPGPVSQFSTGELDSLDHFDLDEESYSPGVAKDFLDGGPAHYQFFGPDSIDFNRDGRLTPGGVRFDFAPLERLHSGNWPIKVGAEQFDTLLPHGGPGLAVFDDRVYAFAAVQFGVVPPILAFARGGTPFLSNFVLLPTSTFDPDNDGETAAALLDFAGIGPRIVVVHPDNTGELHFVVFDPATETAVDEGPIPGFPAGTAARQATMTVVGGRIVVAYRNRLSGNLNLVNYATLSDSFEWSAWQQLTTSSPVDALRSRLTPGIVEGPDGNEYLAAASLSNPIGIDFYVRPAGSTAAFDRLVGPSFPRGELPTNFADENSRFRLNMVFLPYLHADGSVFADDSGYLALFYNHLEEDKASWIRAYVPGFISPTAASFPREGFPPNPIPTRFHTQATVSEPFPEHSLGAVRHFNKTTVVYSQVDCLDRDPNTLECLKVNREGGADPMVHVPFGNGIAPFFSADHDDHDDAARIVDHFCGVWVLDEDDDQCPEICSAPPLSLACPATPPSGLAANADILCDEFPQLQ